MKEPTRPEPDRDGLVADLVDRFSTGHRFNLIVIDDGRFPRSRISELVRIADRVHVIDDAGLAQELVAHGIRVTARNPAGLKGMRAALAVAPGADSMFILTGQPRHSKTWLRETIAASVEAGTTMPVAAVAILRDEPMDQRPGGIAAFAQDSFVSGYGALFAVGYAAAAGCNLTLVSHEAEHLQHRNTEVVEVARELARENQVAAAISTDPSPVDWVNDNSPQLRAAIGAVLHAHRGIGQRVTKTARDSGTAAPLHLIRKAQCDVILVLDCITLSKDAETGVTIAQAVGTGLLTAAAITAGAGPAAAAVAPRPAPIVRTAATRPASVRTDSAADGVDAAAQVVAAAADQIEPPSSGAPDGDPGAQTPAPEGQSETPAPEGQSETPAPEGQSETPAPEGQAQETGAETSTDPGRLAHVEPSEQDLGAVAAVDEASDTAAAEDAGDDADAPADEASDAASATRPQRLSIVRTGTSDPHSWGYAIANPLDEPLRVETTIHFAHGHGHGGSCGSHTVSTTIPAGGVHNLDLAWAPGWFQNCAPNYQGSTIKITGPHGLTFTFTPGVPNPSIPPSLHNLVQQFIPTPTPTQAPTPTQTPTPKPPEVTTPPQGPATQTPTPKPPEVTTPPQGPATQTPTPKPPEVTTPPQGPATQTVAHHPGDGPVRSSTPGGGAHHAHHAEGPGKHHEGHKPAYTGGEDAALAAGGAGLIAAGAGLVGMGRRREDDDGSEGTTDDDGGNPEDDEA